MTVSEKSLKFLPKLSQEFFRNYFKSFFWPHSKWGLLTDNEFKILYAADWVLDQLIRMSSFLWFLTWENSIVLGSNLRFHIWYFSQWLQQRLFFYFFNKIPFPIHLKLKHSSNFRCFKFWFHKNLFLATLQFPLK